MIKIFRTRYVSLWICPTWFFGYQSFKDGWLNWKWEIHLFIIPVLCIGLTFYGKKHPHPLTGIIK